MKCVIRRTSIWGEEKPCEEAYRDDVIYLHERTCTEEEFDKKFSHREGLWRSKGFDHSTPNNGKHILRKQNANEWVADIDLEEFSKKYGRIIYCFDNYTIPTVEIYDDYRE
jgi:hypothetical protein